MTEKSIIILFLMASLLACDPREVDLPAWESEVLVPLINADFDIKDITLNEELRLKEDSTGAISIIYITEKDSVQLKDFFQIPDESINFGLPGIPNGINDFEFSAGISAEELDIPSGTNVIVPPFSIDEINEQADITEHFIEAVFESGELHLSLENGFPFDIDAGFGIEIINIDDGSTVLSYTAGSALMANSSFKITPPISLVGKRMSNQLTVRITNLSSNGTSGADIYQEDRLAISLLLKNIKLAKATLTLPPFTSPVAKESFVFDLPLGAKLTSVQMNTGFVKATMEKTVPFPLNVTLIINSATKDGEALQSVVDLGSDKILDMDLSDLDIDLTNGGQAVANTLTFSLQLHSPGSEEPVTIDFLQPIEGVLEVNSIRPSGVFGYLGTYQHLLTGGVEVDFFRRVVSGSIDFAAPSVTAYIYNEFGAGVRLVDNNNLYVKGANSSLYPGKEVLMTEGLKGVIVQPADTPGGSVLSEIVLNSITEPNFDDFISILPSEMSFSFPVQVGSLQEDLSQFALDTSQVSGYLEVEFPLSFEANALTFTDTLDLDVNFDDQYTHILSGDLITVATNRFPVELLMQVYFMDEEHHILDSLFTERRIISPGEVNEEGKIIKPSQAKFVIILDESAVENLNNSSYIKPLFIMNTSGEEKVKIFSDSRVNLKINGDFKIVLKNQ